MMESQTSWSPDGKYVAAASYGDYSIFTVHVLNAATGAHIYTYRGHTDYLNDHVILAVTWSPDGRYIASGGADNTVQVWKPM